MKKYIIPVIILSIIGGFISIALLFQHYNINSEIVTFFCGDSVNNLCREISLTEYSTFFNFPVAVYSLLFYSFLLIVTIFLLYAGGDYRITYVVIVFPLVSVAIIVSIIFMIVMIKIGLICSLCLIIHLTNIILFAVLALFFKKVKRDKDFNISGLLDKYINTLNTVSHARAGLAAFIAFIIFFVFSIFSISNIIELRTTEKTSYKKIKHYLTRYETAKPENLILHNSQGGNQVCRRKKTSHNRNISVINR